jgi:hypothetical protein
MALYSRLFSYAPLPNRTQLENFLTESLCDWLDRITALDRKCLETFVVQCLAGSRGVPSTFRERLASARNLSWKTQHVFSLIRTVGSSGSERRRLLTANCSPAQE